MQQPASRHGSPIILVVLRGWRIVGEAGSGGPAANGSHEPPDDDAEPESLVHRLVITGGRPQIDVGALEEQADLDALITTRWVPVRRVRTAWAWSSPAP
ncbi:hypothetical protein AC792_13585 [Arthrobacter sp. RIT-PI-e]|uniref:hypothetical protein n=1 Tax=Arthrobacter sp. RIT-PI-e TaxID=1681197 RepID=UPI000675CC13|nr:hypothetical protein [Arthrobacter sp. RIT-PI-e]KNC17866.1 hypothetical protein AC792_13585 [Arthrobacter sp. RIT-PI-e]